MSGHGIALLLKGVTGYGVSVVRGNAPYELTVGIRLPSPPPKIILIYIKSTAFFKKAVLSVLFWHELNNCLIVVPDIIFYLFLDSFLEIVDGVTSNALAAFLKLPYLSTDFLIISNSKSSTIFFRGRFASKSFIS